MAFVNASGWEMEKEGFQGWNSQRGEIPPWEQIREERIMFD
mgnify:CR=1 FL=1